MHDVQPSDRTSYVPSYAIAGQEACSLQSCAVLVRISLQQSTSDAVTDCASLTGEAAAGYGALYVELALGAGYFERLTANHLQGLETEVVVDGAVVDLISPVPPGKRRTRATEDFLLPVP